MKATKKEKLIGKILILSREAGTRKTHKILTDSLFYKSRKEWFFRTNEMFGLSIQRLKEIISEFKKQKVNK